MRGTMSELQTALTTSIDTVENTIGERFGDLEAASKVFDDRVPWMNVTVDELWCFAQDGESSGSRLGCRFTSGHLP